MQPQYTPVILGTACLQNDTRPPARPPACLLCGTQECHDSAPPGLWEAAGVHTLTAREGFRCLLLSLWDPDQRCYVPFPEWAWLDRLLAA
jgi:hypothetical protein